MSILRTRILNACTTKPRTTRQVQELKWIAEAEVVGLEWLKQTRSRYGLFRFTACGHEQEIQNGNIRNNQFKCQSCLEHKLKAEADAVGLTWLKQTRSRYGLFRFTACDHDQEIENSNVRKNLFKCQTCYAHKLKSEAEAVGLTWLKQTREKYGLFRFNDCNHEQEIRNGDVRNNNFKCRTCYEDKLKSEAEAVGLMWLKQTRERYGLFRFKNCGHEQEIRNSDVRDNVFACQVCQGSWATRPSNFYVHLITLQGESFVKAGIAKDIEQRVKGYGLPPEAVVKTVLVMPMPTGKDASDLETKVLRKFKRHQLKNIGHIMTKSGETECFCPSVLSDILTYTRQNGEFDMDNRDYLDDLLQDEIAQAKWQRQQHRRHMALEPGHPDEPNEESDDE